MVWQKRCGRVDSAHLKVSANCLDTTDMLLFMLHELALAKTRIRTARSIAVECLVFDVAVQVAFQVVRGTTSEGAVREATAEGLLPRVCANVHFQVGVAGRAVVTVRIGTLERFLSGVGSEMGGENGLGDRGVITTRIGTLVRLFPRVRTNVDLQIAITDGRVGAILIRTDKPANFGLLKHTVHRTRTDWIQSQFVRRALLLPSVLVFNSCSRHIIHEKEKARDDNELLLCGRVKTSQLLQEHLVLLVSLFIGSCLLHYRAFISHRKGPLLTRRGCKFG